MQTTSSESNYAAFRPKLVLESFSKRQGSPTIVGDPDWMTMPPAGRLHPPARIKWCYTSTVYRPCQPLLKPGFTPCHLFAMDMLTERKRATARERQRGTNGGRDTTKLWIHGRDPHFLTMVSDVRAYRVEGMGRPATVVTALNRAYSSNVLSNRWQHCCCKY